MTSPAPVAGAPGPSGCGAAAAASSASSTTAAPAACAPPPSGPPELARLVGTTGVTSSPPSWSPTLPPFAFPQAPSAVPGAAGIEQVQRAEDHIRSGVRLSTEAAVGAPRPPADRGLERSATSQSGGQVRGWSATQPGPPAPPTPPDPPPVYSIVRSVCRPPFIKYGSQQWKWGRVEHVPSGHESKCASAAKDPLFTLLLRWWVRPGPPPAPMVEAFSTLSVGATVAPLPDFLILMCGRNAELEWNSLRFADSFVIQPRSGGTGASSSGNARLSRD